MLQLNRRKKFRLILLSFFLLSTLIIIALMISANDTAETLLRIKINPEFELYYDVDGNITKVNAVNDDAVEVLDRVENVIGKKCTTATREIICATDDGLRTVGWAERESRSYAFFCRRAS